MVPRKPVTPNNRTANSVMREFYASQTFQLTYPKSNEQPTIRLWARRGRQNSEGFGGGRIVGK